MPMESLSYSRLPGMNALFLDFIDDPERVREFYPSASSIRKPQIPHREELCRILLRQNQGFNNPAAKDLTEKLSGSDTYCIITGQQVGLLTGPMYTLWKALTILKLCHQYEKDGIRCVPVFWMASEDHNWHEIMNFALLRDDQSLQQFSLKDHFFLQRQPAGSLPVTHPEVRKILLRCFRDITIPPVKEFYTSGTLANAFARTLLWLLRDFPILVVDPSDPELKKLASPFFGKFFDRSESMLEALSRQNQLLQERNYPVQVKMEDDVLPLFSLEKGERRHVPRGTKSAPPEQLSPSALLRPLFQDYLFPTLAYIGGPAEIAYFAQLHPWYDIMEMEQPRVMSRASLTLLPQATRNFLRNRNLKPEELYTRDDILFDALLRNDDLESTRKEIAELRKIFLDRFTRARASAEKIEKTLDKATRTAERKIDYQLEKLERKTLFAARRKDTLLSEQIQKAKNVIQPAEKLQERSLNIFSFASRLPDLIAEVYNKINLDIKAHLWISI